MTDTELVRQEPPRGLARQMGSLPDRFAQEQIARVGLKQDHGRPLEYWHMIRRHKGAVVIAAGLGAILGFLVTLSSPRVYQSRLTMEIQGLTDLNMQNVNPTTGTSGPGMDLQTHVTILQSRLLNDRTRLKVERQKPPDDLRPPDRLGMWRKALNINPPTQEDLWRQAVGAAAGSVAVRWSGVNRIVDVSCDSTNPQVAADFCNTLAREYIEQHLESGWAATEHTGEWLTKQLDDLKTKLEKSEEELQEYARATGLVYTGEKTDAQEAVLIDLQKELSAAQADRIAKQSKYEMAKASPSGSLPEVLDDTTLKDSQAALTTLQAKLAQLKVTYTSNHAEVKQVEAQIAALQSAREGSRANIVSRIGQEFEAAQRREGLLTAAYTGQARLMSGKAEETAHYSLLRRKVDASRLLYENLLQKVKEASIASALRANTIRVVDAALPAHGPYKPNVTQRTGLGILAGLVVGIAFVVRREQSDRTPQNLGDTSLYLGVPELGVVPIGYLLEASGKGSGGGDRSAAGDPGAGSGAPEEGRGLRGAATTRPQLRFLASWEEGVAELERRQAES